MRHVRLGFIAVVGLALIMADASTTSALGLNSRVSLGTGAVEGNDWSTL